MSRWMSQDGPGVEEARAEQHRTQSKYLVDIGHGIFFQKSEYLRNLHYSLASHLSDVKESVSSDQSNLHVVDIKRSNTTSNAIN